MAESSLLFVSFHFLGSCWRLRSFVSQLRAPQKAMPPIHQNSHMKNGESVLGRVWYTVTHTNFLAPKYVHRPFVPRGESAPARLGR